MADQPLPNPDGAAPQGANATTEAAGQGGSGGLPQFDPTWWPGQIVWLLIIFAVLYAVLWKVLLPKVGGAIDAREGRISGDIADARRLKQEAESQAATAAAEMAGARAKAQKLGSDAKAKSAAQAAERQKVEEAKLNERLALAEADIRAARDQAMTNVRGIAVETAKAIVEKLTGTAASSVDLEAAMSARGA
ncbi:MAG: synthase subunit [Caulobacteraceae bacterium]|nr:synthase subunit [Caulobacteraceae bacterium]